jgi:hypothetical protein
MFYSEDETVGEEHHFMSDIDTEMLPGEKEGQEMIPQLERRFMPHELVSISIYEDDHPMSECAINTSICHRAPEELPAPIAERMTIVEPFIAPNYIYKIFDEANNW